MMSTLRRNHSRRKTTPRPPGTPPTTQDSTAWSPPEGAGGYHGPGGNRFATSAIPKSQGRNIPQGGDGVRARPIGYIYSPNSASEKGVLTVLNTPGACHEVPPVVLVPRLCVPWLWGPCPGLFCSGLWGPCPGLFCSVSPGSGVRGPGSFAPGSFAPCPRALGSVPRALLLRVPGLWGPSLV